MCIKPLSAARPIIIVIIRVPHALLVISVAWMGSWVIIACGMSSQTSWITRHNCTMVCGGGPRDLIWQSVRSLVHARWGTGRWVCWPGHCMHCIWSSDVLCESHWERKGAVPSPSGALQHVGAYSEWGLGNAADYIWSVWVFGNYDVLVFLQQFLWMASTDPTTDAGLRRICQSCDGVVPGGRPSNGCFRWSQSLLGDVSTTELLFVAHWNVWRHLQSSSSACSIPIVLSLSTMVKP